MQLVCQFFITTERLLQEEVVLVVDDSSKNAVDGLDNLEARYIQLAFPFSKFTASTWYQPSIYSTAVIWVPVLLISRSMPSRLNVL